MKTVIKKLQVGTEDYKFEYEKNICGCGGCLRLETPGYISLYQHNTPESLIELSEVGLLCG